jgi:hypothetical protein
MARTSAQRALMAALNDQARRAFHFFSDVYETAGFGSLPHQDRQAARFAVERYDAFEADTDPDGEHDYGVIFRLADGSWLTGREWRNESLIVVCWKFDYFDQMRINLSLEPWDSAVTRRKLTIALEEEILR